MTTVVAVCNSHVNPWKQLNKKIFTILRFRDFFFTILGRGPRAFQIGKISVVGKPLNWEICFIAQLHNYAIFGQ